MSEIGGAVPRPADGCVLRVKQGVDLIKERRDFFGDAVAARRLALPERMALTPASTRWTGLRPSPICSMKPIIRTAPRMHENRSKVAGKAAGKRVDIGPVDGDGDPQPCAVRRGPLSTTMVSWVNSTVAMRTADLMDMGVPGASTSPGTSR
jgi:hypothetical protein